jgi:cysteine desulfurase
VCHPSVAATPGEAMSRFSYLDYNATAPVRPAVIEAVRDALERMGNPSSVHRYGREARRALEHARELVAAMVGAAPAQVVFTSGGTEANNQALRSVRGPVAVSAIEHDSVLAAAPDAARIAVDAEGRLDLAALERELARASPVLVSVMLANNETGVIQPVREVVEVARRHGARVHADAVQAAGKLAIDIDALGADFLTLSAHKFGGPQGVGALVVAKGREPDALLRGGGQERGWRPGTENLPGIVGFGRACELATADADWWRRTAALRHRLEARLTRLAPAARVFGREAERLPNTTCITMPGVSNQTQLIEFDLAGIAVSTGSACSSGKVGPSHVLAAMGVEPEAAASAIRISLGWASTADEVDHLIDAWGRLYTRTRHPLTDTLARPA